MYDRIMYNDKLKATITESEYEALQTWEKRYYQKVYDENDSPEYEEYLEDEDEDFAKDREEFGMGAVLGGLKLDEIDPLDKDNDNEIDRDGW